jgi:hypothetical protein
MTLGEEANRFLFLIRVVYPASSLTRISGVGDGAVLPVWIIHELALEIERVVDVGETELDVVASTCILASLDAIYLALYGALTASKLQEHGLRPVLFGIDRSHAPRRIPFDTIADHVIGGSRSGLLLDENDGVLLASYFDAVFCSLEVFVASLGSQEPHDREA